MFKKILIANRGEIACRITDTARRMGIRTVAVFSRPDRGARHVELADEAVYLGGDTAAESYLQPSLIIDAALRMSAEAVHPGYGFLSENAEFAEKIENAGLTFIGPTAKSIRAMGLKDAAKSIMADAGVPVVPGYHGDRQEPEFLAQEALQIGFPVLIKARAGGGGKGMRRVSQPGDFHEALLQAQREAQASFGDGRVLIEKWIENPRHIEVQVFGDRQGTVLSLFERDCSLQRRHQKVIEEAPAPGISQDMRTAICKAAELAAKTIDYQGAGTVEFIAEASQSGGAENFYFMEMNTRLQVEHPVTEAIAGLDLVEWQLRVAAGAPLPSEMAEMAISGHAVEARIYAEDAENGFLPAAGRVAHLSFPDGIRIDTGIRSGDAISPHYDPLIAKVIAHGATRTEALHRLSTALRRTEIAGLTTNRAFLARLVEHPGFLRGEIDTGLIERDIDLLTKPAAPREAWAIAALKILGLLDAANSGSPFETLGAWRLWGEAMSCTTLRHSNTEAEIALMSEARDQYRVRMADDNFAIRVLRDGPQASIEADNLRLPTRAAIHGEAVTVFLDGEDYVFERVAPTEAGDRGETSEDAITAPMTGALTKVLCVEGALVDEQAPLAVIEAMKMEYTLRAPRKAKIAEVHAEAGTQVEQGALLFRLETGDGRE